MVPVKKEEVEAAWGRGWQDGLGGSSGALRPSRGHECWESIPQWLVAQGRVALCGAEETVSLGTGSRLCPPGHTSCKAGVP